ncbi:MAG: helix-turn-helix domain-containing protein [Pseudomonadota bacterium]
MARYSKSHKETSRQALLSAAARLFRANGFNGVGIDQLCAGAGLTRGAFYAHFRSKRALFESVLQGPHDFIERLLSRKSGRVAEGAAKVATDYLTPVNRTAVLGGCSLASLAMDTARGEAKAQQAYADAVEKIVAEFKRDHPTLNDADARAALALCVGGLLVSAACGESASADKIERAARRQVETLLAV